MGITLAVLCGWLVLAFFISQFLRDQMRGNETHAAAACKSFCEAQELYRRTDWDGDGVLEYAQSIGRGEHSFYSHTANLNDPCDPRLVDRAFALAEGPPGVAQPRYGYCFKVLTAQGVDASGGQRSYVVDGNMTLGYALLAYPAYYDLSGRDSFIVNNNGVIFQCDLGPQTRAIAEGMKEYNSTPGVWGLGE